VDAGTDLVLWSDPRASLHYCDQQWVFAHALEVLRPRFARKGVPKADPPGIITIQCSVSSGIKALWKLNKENGDVNSASVRHSYTVISKSLKTRDGSPAWARTTITLINAESVTCGLFNGLKCRIGPEKTHTRTQLVHGRNGSRHLVTGSRMSDCGGGLWGSDHRAKSPWQSSSLGGNVSCSAWQ
jgi:hypothetical protein